MWGTDGSGSPHQVGPPPSSLASAPRHVRMQTRTRAKNNGNQAVYTSSSSSKVRTQPPRAARIDVGPPRSTNQPVKAACVAWRSALGFCCTDLKFETHTVPVAFTERGAASLVAAARSRRLHLLIPFSARARDSGVNSFLSRRCAAARSRGSELPQRASPRAPLHLKTTTDSSDSNGAHHRSVLDRSSPKVAADRHSPRSPLPEKKRAGTRVAELETKLGKVQDELKKLREQLVSAEAAKKDAQVALEEAKKHVGTKGSPKAAAASPPSPAPVPLENEKETDEVKVAEPAATEEEEEEESSINSPAATDVFEVVRTESGDKENQSAEDSSQEVSCGDKPALAEDDVEVEETKTMIEEACNGTAATGGGGEKESPEVVELKAQLMAREMEVAVLTADNAELKKLATEAARRAEEDAVAKAFLIEQELKENAAREARMGEQLRASDAAREALEGEMRRLRVQTEQWRKAAEAAAAVIGGDAHLVGHHGLAGNGNGWGSPATMPDDLDDEGFGSKRKGAGIRMLGDLWKKKGNK